MDVPDIADVRRALINSTRSRATSMTPPAAWPPAGADELDFIGWADPKAPRRAYLVLGPPALDDVVAVELRLPTAGARPARRTMCDVCRTTEAPAGSVLMVAPRAGGRGRSGDSVGLCLCTDFACSARARQPLRPHEQSLTGMHDTRVADVVERITAFVDRVRS